MDTPKISVIVPIYKAERYLHQCVDSLLAQTFDDYEIILIDDGSPDRSGEICDEYAAGNSRVRVFHKENGGVSSARNCGMDNAHGEYTIHADPDDWVEPTMLEELYAKAKEEDADMVICDFYCDRGKKSKYVRQQPSALDSETVLRELFQQLHGSCWNKLVRRACYNSLMICYPNKISLSEDLYVNLRLLMSPDIKITYLGKAFYHYVQDANSNSLSRDKTRRQVRLMDEMHATFSDLLVGTPYERLHYRRLFGDAFAMLWHSLLSRDEFRERYEVLNNEPVFNFQSRCVRLALRHFGLAVCIVKLRKAISDIYHIFSK